MAVAIVPALWALIGGSAATLLDVPTDYVLLAAGVTLMVILVRQCIPSQPRSYARQRHSE